ncbi:hypothetical protein B0H14DRAFT_2651308 [Mycena olivaceomarginata]|nr:hypothetical protein B0H14DRAFT_2651308 [Mycena olivaceomarginata]
MPREKNYPPHPEALARRRWHAHPRSRARPAQAWAPQPTRGSHSSRRQDPRGAWYTVFRFDCDPNLTCSQIAEIAPVACAHLPVVMMMCRTQMISAPASRLLGLFDSFGVKIRRERTQVLPWLMMEFIGDDASTARLQRLLKDEADGALERFNIEARITPRRS